MIFLYVLLILILLYFIYLLIIIFLPVLKVEPQPFAKKLVIKDVPTNRADVSFVIDGDKVSCWYYSTLDRVPIGCVILSHGFNGTKDCLLEKYALEFCNAGFSVLTYDYRTYGDSEGQPRQLLSVTKQIDDLRGAVEFINKSKEINNIYLWGTSAGASYGLVVAPEYDVVKGVICQCGAYDHKEDEKKGMEENGMMFYISLLPHGVRDKWRTKLGLSNHIVPAYGRTGTKVFLRGDSLFYGAEKLAEESENFINEVSAYFMLQPHGPDVLEVSKGVKCPVLVLTCENDEIISPRSHLKLQEILGDLLSVVSYPIGHFDIYSGEWYKKAICEQLVFLNGLSER